MDFRKNCNKIRHHALNLMFPERFCLVCGRNLFTNADLCPDCKAKLELSPRCGSCDGFVAASDSDDCVWCRRFLEFELVKRVIALPYQDKTRNYLLALKYERALYVARSAGRLLANRLVEKDIKADLVLAVPLHPARQKERGYNQAGLLAKAVAAELDLPCEFEALRRVKNTAAQYGLSAKQRFDNIKDAFAPGKQIQKLKGKSVIVVDDIITTGATILAINKTLRSAGVGELIFAAVAAPVFDHSNI